MKNLLKNKKLVIIGSIIILIILFFVFIKAIGGNKSVYGSRCSDSDNYKLSSKTVKKVKDTIKTIDKVNDIDIHTKLCTVKIIINLSEDVDIEAVKNMSNELLKNFSKKELKYYDFSLYVTSDNKDSEVYPVNVTRHNSKDSFAW